jgi:hypothetical protein
MPVGKFMSDAAYPVLYLRIVSAVMLFTYLNVIGHLLEPACEGSPYSSH